MPVVTITALDPASPPDLASVGAALAEALGCPTGDVWLYWTPAAAVAGPAAPSCPLVVVRGRPRPDVPAALAAVAAATAAAFGVPVEDVWVAWEDVLPGRAFAGGAVVT